MHLWLRLDEKRSRERQHKKIYSQWDIQPKHPKLMHNKECCKVRSKRHLSTQSVSEASLLLAFWMNVTVKADQKSEWHEIFSTFAGRGDKEASDTAETGAAQMWDEKKGVEKNPKPNSIFGLGSDLASFNLELFAYSDQWDHYSLRLRHKAALVAFGAKPQRYLHLLSADSGNRSESSSFGAFQLFFS